MRHFFLCICFGIVQHIICLYLCFLFEFVYLFICICVNVTDFVQLVKCGMVLPLLMVVMGDAGGSDGGGFCGSGGDAGGRWCPPRDGVQN